MQFNLPYFDMILSRLACGDPEFEEVFWRHVHFGAWADPKNAYSDLSDFVRAMERLCLHLIELADIGQDQEVLDVGCGFGGTIACIDEHFSPVRLTGLNIDQRQLDVATQHVKPSSGNKIDFVLGDACAMTFPEDSFDRVLAVECIFHFPSREAFLERAGGILRSGGNLTLSDFLQPEGTPAGLWDDPDNPLWGSHTAIDIEEYRKLGARFGLELVHAQDISPLVWPSYHWYGQLLGKHFPEAQNAAVDPQIVMGAGGLGYCTLRFDRR